MKVSLKFVQTRKKEQERKKWSYLSSFLTSPRLAGAPPSRISPENAKADANVREEKGKWENEVGTRRKLMKMKEQWPLTIHRRWPPENEAADTGNSPDLQGETKMVHWVREESKTTEIKGKRGEGRSRRRAAASPRRCRRSSPELVRTQGWGRGVGWEGRGEGAARFWWEWRVNCLWVYIYKFRENSN